MAKAMANLDSLQPVYKRRSLSLEPMQSKVRLDQNFLGKIFSIVRFPRDVPAVSDDPSLITQD
jgi:hypothetical protein